MSRLTTHVQTVSERLAKFFPARTITIRTRQESHEYFFSPAFQAGLCVTSFALLLGICGTTAITLSLLPNDGKNREIVSGAENAEGSDDILQLLATAEKLKDEADAAIELASLALEDNQRLAQELVDLTRGEDSTNPETSGETERLLTSLETAVDKLREARVEAEFFQESNAQLLQEQEKNKVRTIRFVSRLANAVKLTADEVGVKIDALGLNSGALTNEIESLYSGIGGLNAVVDAPDTLTAEAPLSNIDTNDFATALHQLSINKLVHQSLPIGHPVKTSNRLSSAFGNRYHPVYGRHEHHSGVDFAAPRGTAIHVTGNGVVKYVGRLGAYGKTVIVKHAGDIETLYAHLSKINVERGQRVWRGDKIGDIGSTGVSTGPHLHYEVQIAGRAVNPMKFITAE